MLGRLKRLLFPSTVHDEEAQGRGARLVAAGLVVLAIAALAFGGLVLAKKSSRVNAWMAQRAAAKATEYADKGEFSRAQEEFAEAWKRGMTDETTVRRLSHLASRYQPAEAASLWAQLERLTGELSEEEKHLRIAALASAGQMDEANRLSAELLDESDQSPDSLRTAAAVARRSGRFKDALGFYRRLDEEKKATEDDYWEWSKLLVSMPGEYGHEASIRTLIEACGQPGDRGREAVGVLVRHPPRDDIPTMRSFLDRSLGRDDLDARLRTQVVRLEADLFPQNRWSMMQREVEHWQEAPPHDIPPLLDWLMELSAYEEISRILADDKKALGPAIRHYCTALLYQGRNNELDRLLASGNSSLTPCVLDVYRAHLERVRGAPQERLSERLEKAIWTGAESLDIDGLLVAGNYAHEIGLDSLAVSAIRRAAISEKERPVANLALHQIGTKLRRADIMLEGAERLRDSHSQFGRAAPEALYLRLLMGSTLEEDRAEVVAGAHRYPGDARWRLAKLVCDHRFGAGPPGSEGKPDEESIAELRFGERSVLAVLEGEPRPLTGSDDWMLDEEVALLEAIAVRRIKEARKRAETGPR